MIRRAPLAALVLAAACARPEVPAGAQLVTVTSLEGAPVSFADLVGRANFTVIEFFSAHCPVQATHDARLRALDESFRARGVQLVAIDSEVGASVQRDVDEQARRGYAFSILVDRGARLANALGAEFSTYTLIVDRAGRVRYRGGIDSDRTHLTRDATHFVRDALDSLLEGRAPPVVESKTLGCALQKS